MSPVDISIPEPFYAPSSVKDHFLKILAKQEVASTYAEQQLTEYKKKMKEYFDKIKATDSDEEALDEEEISTSSFGPPGEDTPEEMRGIPQPNPTPSFNTTNTTTAQKQFEDRQQNKINPLVTRSKAGPVSPLLQLPSR